MAIIDWVSNMVHSIVVGNSVEQSIKNIDNSHNVHSKSHKHEQKAMGFQMPLHYPRYTKVEYENMEEWKVDALLREYGLDFQGTVDEKRNFAIGAFLWPDQF